MIILLPPSEGKSTGSGEDSFLSLNKEMALPVQSVLDHLKTLTIDEIGKFYSVKDAEKAAAIQAKNLKSLTAGCIPALQRYTGVVYSHLDYDSLKAKKRAEGRIYIVSGLFGLISGGTAIPDYKMPMNTWLRKYWLAENTARLKALSKKAPVVSLLPQVYAKAVGLEHAVHVEFKIDGGKKLAGHFGKAIKGKFVRFLIEKNIQSIDDFDQFNEDGFEFDGHDFIQTTAY